MGISPSASPSIGYAWDYQAVLLEAASGLEEPISSEHRAAIEAISAEFLAKSCGFQPGEVQLQDKTGQTQELFQWFSPYRLSTT